MQQQQNGGTIPRIVVVIGDGDIEGTCVFSDAPISYVIVSDAAKLVEVCEGLDAIGDLDTMYKMGVDPESKKRIVVTGPYDVRCPLQKDVDAYWRQAPYFNDPAQNDVPGLPSEPVSEPVRSEIPSGNPSGNPAGNPGRKCHGESCPGICVVNDDGSETCPVCGRGYGAPGKSLSAPELELSIEVVPDDSPDTSYLTQTDPDFSERLAAYENGDFFFVGVRADYRISFPDGSSISGTSPGLWSMESDSDGQHFWDTAEEELLMVEDAVVSHGITQEQFAAAMTAALEEKVGVWDGEPKMLQFKRHASRARAKAAVEKLGGDQMSFQRREDGTAVVLAHQPGAAAPWVTWLWDDSGSLYWGHYYHLREHAEHDFIKRVED